MLHITPGERSALALLANGGLTAQIAVSLGVPVGEVGGHLRSLFVRMDCINETEAVAAAWRRGLLNSGDESLEHHARRLLPRDGFGKADGPPPANDVPGARTTVAAAS